MDTPVKVTFFNVETLKRFTVTGWGDTDGPLVSTHLGSVNRRTLKFTPTFVANQYMRVLDVH